MTRKLGSSPTGPAVLMSKFVQGLQIYMLPQYVAPNPQANLSAGVTLRRATVTITLANKDTNGARILADAGQDLSLVITDSAVPRRNFLDFEVPPPGPAPWSIAFLLRFTLSVALVILIAIRCWPPGRFCGESSGAPDRVSEAVYPSPFFGIVCSASLAAESTTPHGTQERNRRFRGRGGLPCPHPFRMLINSASAGRAIPASENRIRTHRRLSEALASCQSRHRHAL